MDILGYLVNKFSIIFNCRYNVLYLGHKALHLVMISLTLFKQSHSSLIIDVLSSNALIFISRSTALDAWRYICKHNKSQAEHAMNECMNKQPERWKKPT